MSKAKTQYTVEEAAQYLQVNRTTVLVLLSSIRPEEDVSKVRKIHVRELERIYGMLRKEK